MAVTPKQLNERKNTLPSRSQQHCQSNRRNDGEEETRLAVYKRGGRVGLSGSVGRSGAAPELDVAEVCMDGGGCFPGRVTPAEEGPSCRDRVSERHDLGRNKTYEKYNPPMLISLPVRMMRFW